MAEKEQQPGKYDVVMGGQSQAPPGAAVLGGMLGAKMRFSNPATEVRIAALGEALKYGEKGLDLIVEALEDREMAVQWAAYKLLEGRPERKAKERLEKWPPSYEFATVKVNRRGEIIQRKRGKARYFREELGKGISLDMVYIPGGSYLMGTDDAEIKRLNQKYQTDGFNCEKPQHQVILPPFFMGKYPVTQAQWKAIASLPPIDRDLNPDPARFKGENRPVETVNWDKAVEFCKRLAKKTGRDYRLPSEAEWEYACRAIYSPLTPPSQGGEPKAPLSKVGGYPPFYFGETITTDLANYNGNYTYSGESTGVNRRETTPVGQFPPNPFGLYDLHGNVWEWCADAWQENYQGASTDGSAWTDGANDTFILRGGCWFDGPDFCRSTHRIHFTRADDSYGDFGFRVVCPLGT
jgi:formylglycine-generating enzyme required for sulfatase activity